MFKITDYRVYGIAYDFMQFDGINAMGGMELIMDLDTYQATLQTITPCTSIRIPADVYARWLRTDIRALKQEAKIMGHYLYEQGVTSRTYMFVPGTDRVAVLFEHRYKKYAKNGKLTFTNTRQELAEYSGLSVKTVNRAVKKFEEQGLISRSGKTFYIDEGQYEQLHALVSKLIEPLIERVEMMNQIYEKLVKCADAVKSKLNSAEGGIDLRIRSGRLCRDHAGGRDDGIH